MKLTVFNGSPRGTKSNSSILMERFFEGFVKTEGNEYEMLYLNRVNDQAVFIEKFAAAEAVLIIFPMYTDAMPGIVKTFIESLVPLTKNEKNPPLAAIIQYGFSEGIQGKYIAEYMEKLAKRLKSPFLGVATRGSIEGIQAMPPVMTKKLFTRFHDLGEGFGRNGRFDPELVAKIKGRERFSLAGRMTVRIMEKLKVSSMYWDNLLKGNDAFERRYDKPDID